MDKYKRLKDPIYGYISIPDEYMHCIVDTAIFQRLRRIIQTSYAPLYSSAVHNRFVHSLGVYYLGSIASKQLVEEICEYGLFDSKQVEKLQKIFLLACLLHDLGHAPFSHTGEAMYLDLEGGRENRYIKSYLKRNAEDSWTINESLLGKVKNELEKLDTSGLGFENIAAQKKDKEKIIKL